MIYHAVSHTLSCLLYYNARGGLMAAIAHQTVDVDALSHLQVSLRFPAEKIPKCDHQKGGKVV